MSKRFLAIALAATMVVCSGITAFAADSETHDAGTALVAEDGSGVTGTATQEGLVNTKVYRVTLPVIPQTSLNYTIDPQGLIAATSGARYGVPATGTGLYFVNHKTLDATTEGEKSGLSQTSDEFSVVNKSTFPITVTVKSTATVGTAADHTLVPTLASDEAALTGATKVLLTYKDNATAETPAALATSGTAVSKSAVLGDAKAAYEFKYTEGTGGTAGSYSYTFDADGTYDFATLKFSYTGAVNVTNVDQWTIETAATANANEVRYTAIAAPTINVKYKLDEYTVASTDNDYNIDIAGPDSQAAAAATSISGAYVSANQQYDLTLPDGITLNSASDVTNLKVNGVAITNFGINNGKNKVRIDRSAVKSALGGDTGDWATTNTFEFTFTAGGVNYKASNVAKNG